MRSGVSVRVSKRDRYSSMSGSHRPAFVWSFSSCGERLVVRRVDLPDLLPRGRRCIGLGGLVGPERGDRAVLLDLLRRVFQRGGALHLHVDDVGPLLLGAVDRLEGVDRLEVGADLEQLSPRFGRVVRLRELLPVRLAELAEDLLELVLVEHRRGAIDDLVECLNELARVLLAPADRGDRAKRRQVCVVDVEDAGPILDREVVPLQLVAEDAGAPRENVHAVVVALRDVEQPLEDVDELSPCLPRVVEVRQRAEGFRVLAAQVQDELPGVDRACRLVRGASPPGWRSWRGSLPRRRPRMRSRARARRRR